MHPLYESVAALMREAAETIVMPRHRALEEGHVVEKSPGDLVTIADREAELFLTPRLAALMADSRVIGEEAVEEDPTLLDGIGEGMVWLVDPIDGTNNFARGEGPFAVMIALVADGVTEAGWLFDPVSGRMCHAARGGGAFLDGRRVVAKGVGGPGLSGALSTRFVPPDLRARIERRFVAPDRLVPGLTCAGADYPETILGRRDFVLFWKSMPWDHAPGALILEEAGGRVSRPDGRPYRVDDMTQGILAAATPELWDLAAEKLFNAD